MTVLAEAAYVAGFSFVAASGAMHHRLRQLYSEGVVSQADLPATLAPLNALAFIGNIVLLAAFPVGIWRFGWWVPLWMLISIFTATTYLVSWAERQPRRLLGGCFSSGFVGVGLFALGAAVG